MKDITRKIFPVICLFLASGAPALAHCQNPDLTASIADFDSEQAAPLEVLLRLGEKYQLCFGIEYVDRALLTSPADFHVRSTTVGGAIKLVLTSLPGLTIRASNGVIEISREPRTPNIFDYVIPIWDEPQALPAQLVNFLLNGEVMKSVNPEMKGFAGHTGSANPSDIVGPFKEFNRPVRYLLDRIVGGSTGAAWIATASWTELRNLALVEDRRVWTVAEYGGPDAQYAPLLRAVAEKLPRLENER